jgi:hypothetical protein
MIPRTLIVALALATTLPTGVACDAAEKPTRAERSPAAPTTRGTTAMKINLKIGDRTLTATLHDTPTARDFAAMLPRR